MTAIRQEAIKMLEKVPEDKLGFVIQIVQGVNGLYNDEQSERKGYYSRLWEPLIVTRKEAFAI